MKICHTVAVKEWIFFFIRPHLFAIKSNNTEQNNVHFSYWSLLGFCLLYDIDLLGFAKCIQSV